MNGGRLVRRLLFPHPAIVTLLVPAAAAGLIYGFAALEETDVRRIGAYVLSFYALMVLCLRIPAMFTFVRKIRRENPYYLRYSSDVRLRMGVSLWGAFAYNVAYAVFQLALGTYHHSAWFYAMAGYYALLAVLRLMLGQHVRRFAPGERKQREWRAYRLCGAGLLMMNAALTVFVLYFVRHLRVADHHEITVIAMAAYTFGSLTLAIINVVRYRRYDSPVCSAAMALSLATAVVSMLSLEDAMLTTFEEGSRPMFRPMMLGASGMTAALFIIGMAVYMIVRAAREMNKEQE